MTPGKHEIDMRYAPENRNIREFCNTMTRPIQQTTTQPNSPANNCRIFSAPPGSRRSMQRVQFSVMQYNSANWQSDAFVRKAYIFV